MAGQSRPRILWISNHTPFLTDFGGGQRSNMIYRAVRSIGEVDVLLSCAPQLPGCTVEQTHGTPDNRMDIAEPLKRGELWPWSLVRPLQPHIVDRLAHNLGRRKVDYQRDPKVGGTLDKMCRDSRYDLVIGRHVRYPCKAGVLGRIPTIIDIDDNELEALTLISQDRNTTRLRRVVLRRRVRTLSRIIPRLLDLGEYLWVPKEEDRNLPGCGRAIVLPNIPFAMSLPHPPGPLPLKPACQTILFVGMLSYVYNVEGIDSFLRYSWPIIRREHPQAVLRLVGSRLNDQDGRRWSQVEGVDVIGHVDRLDEFYRDCAFAVIPVWSGGGTNIKVVEAFMYGRTCVVSLPAHRGYAQFRDGEALLVGATPEEMGRKCIELLRSSELTNRLAMRGTELMRISFSYEQFARVVVRTAEEALFTTRTPAAYLPEHQATRSWAASGSAELRIPPVSESQ